MFSISKWAAQTFLVPKIEVKDEAPASNAEMIDLTGDVDSPGAGGSSRDVRSNGGDGATTAGADAGANGWTKMMDVTSSAIVWTKTEPPGDAPSTAEEVKSEVKSEAVADSDVEKYAKFYAPRGRVPNPNAERFASARRAAARVDKVRAPIPVSGDEWGAKLPVTNIQDGTVTPGTFEGAIFEPGRVPSFTGVTLGASKPRGVLSSYDEVLIEGLDPGWRRTGRKRRRRGSVRAITLKSTRSPTKSTCATDDTRINRSVVWRPSPFRTGKQGRIPCCRRRRAR